MIILNMQAENIPDVAQLHNNDFPFPDVQNPAFISNKIVVSEGKIIGAGMVRLTAEGILILDESLPRRVRVESACSVIEALKKDVKNKGLDECHVFVRKPNVQRFLRHCGFIDCQGGQPMVIHF